MRVLSTRTRRTNINRHPMPIDRRILGICMAVCLGLGVTQLGLFSQGIHASLEAQDSVHPEQQLPSLDINDPYSRNDDSAPLDLTSFAHCATATPFVNAVGAFTTKPIWFSMFPDTISETLHKSLINSLTGTSAGGKSFYASIKGKLRHCIGSGQSVTCSNVHPKIKMSRGPDSLSNDFYSKYIMVLRNPMGNFPSSYNAKSAKYSGIIGQVPEEDWRKVRDEWFETMWQEWKETITTWNNTSSYDVGMYFVYEDVYDATRGLKMMKKLRSFLLEAGFDVAAEEALACIWYNAVGKDKLERFHKSNYGDYDDYVPGFLQEQKTFLLHEMEVMMKEFEDGATLVEILGGYRNDIESKIRIDAPSTTASD